MGAGVPYYWHAVAAALAETHEVHVFAANDYRPENADIAVHRVAALRAGWFLSHVTFSVVLRGRFAFMRLAGNPFDLVLGIGALTPFADVATVHFVQARELALQRRGAFPRERPHGGLASLDYGLYARTMSWIGRRFYRRARGTVVAISEAVKHDLVAFEGAAPERVVVVPNGVDVDRFHPVNRDQHRVEMRERLGLDDSDIAVLFVGNSWGRKGLRTAIEAIGGPGQANVRLVVVGVGEPAAFVEGQSAEVVDRIIFAGAEPGGVERYYASADVFLLPTVYEPFGLVILEALASGLPTIVSACAGASEWLEDGVHAVLLRDPSDGIEARAALRSVIDDPAFAGRLAQDGRRAALGLQWTAVGAALVAAASRPPVHARAHTRGV
jgi:UDP-glucose:(heptosyl)LPS alpha-1,3-glucosyltransferase